MKDEKNKRKNIEKSILSKITIYLVILSSGHESKINFIELMRSLGSNENILGTGCGFAAAFPFTCNRMAIARYRTI
jgi:hypothetical protein